MPLNRRFLAIGGFALLLIFGLLVGTGVIPGFKRSVVKTEITIWGFDNPSVWSDITSGYHSANPAITVKYVQLSPEEYENLLVNGLATGQGPDIFMIGNAWLPKHGNKLAPAPADIVSYAQADSLFPAAVMQDFTANGAVYALPLYMDTLGLIYNKDIFDAKGVALPPSNWLTFQELVRKLGKGSAAIGGTNRTMQNAADIVSVLMMQAGAPMVETDGRTSFRGGEDGLAFYAKFADPRSSYYTWDDRLPADIERFAQGSLPMMFGYHGDVSAIRRANPALRVGTSPMLQSSGAPLTIPSYAGLAVWSQSRNQAVAWAFIRDLTTVPENAMAYANAIGEPAALRATASAYANDPLMRAFAGQLLTARSWPRADENTARSILSAMIESVTSGLKSADQAAQEAANRLNGL